MTQGVRARVEFIRGFNVRHARLAIGVFPIIVAAAAAAAARTGMLPLAVGASSLLVLLLIGLRSPVLVLALFAALIPIEDTLNFSGVGTAARIVGLVFVVVCVSRRGLPRPAVIPFAGWAFVLWATASGVWALDVSAWASSTFTLLQMFVLALFVGDLVSDDPGVVRRIMWAYSSSAVLSVLVLVVSPSGFAGSDRLTAFTGQDPAQFSATLVPAFLFLVYEGARLATQRTFARVVAVLILAGSGLVMWGALVSGTRSAIVGLLVGLAVMAVPGTGNRGGRLSIGAIGIGGAVVAFLAPGVSDSVLDRLSNALITGGSGRQDIWAVGATIFAQHPLVGVGYASFPSAFTSDVIRLSVIPGLDPAAVFEGRGPHSIVIGTAAELGIVGIALLSWFLLRVLTARPSSKLWPFIRAAVIGMLAQAMLLDVLNRKQLWLILGVALGLALAKGAAERQISGRHLLSEVRWPTRELSASSAHRTPPDGA